MQKINEQKISGKIVDLKLAKLSDAKTILKFRLSKISRFLPQVENDVNQQLNWLEQYKKRENQGIEYYFIVEDKQKNPIGTIRINEIDYTKKTFSLASFIIDRTNQDVNKFSAFEAITLIFDFAFNQLNLDISHFFCRKENYMASGFYEKYGIKLDHSDEENFYYKFTKNEFNEKLKQYLKVIDENAK